MTEKKFQLFGAWGLVIIWSRPGGIGAWILEFSLVFSAFSAASAVNGFSPVLITNPKSSPGVDPADGAGRTGDPASSTFQTPLVGEGNVIFPQNVAFRRANVQTRLQVATPALFFLQGDMDFPVYVKFIKG
jgi:hypothetical protein